MDSLGGLPDDVVTALQEAIPHLYGSEDLEETLGRVTAVAAKTVAGCDVASITLINGGTLSTHGATGDVAAAADAIQYETGEGPCLDAAEGDIYVHTPNLAGDARWPKFSARVARELGVGSMFACRLSMLNGPGQTMGALNLYAMAPEGFSEEDRMVALLLASVSAVTVDAARRQANLRQAMESRDVIGQAKGILMARSQISADDAFDTLRRASQRLNVKLRDLAERIAQQRSAGDI